MNLKLKLLNNPWFVCFIAGLFFFYEFIQMSVFNAIGDSILQSFSIRVTALASISAAYFYSMVIFLLPAGILLDKFSSKKIILTAFSLSVGGTILFSFSNSVIHAELCRMISGAGGAFAFLGCIKLASRWFSGSKMSLVVGLLITMAFLGGAIAQTPFTILVEHYGWRSALHFLSLFGILSIILIALFVKNSPNVEEATAPKIENANISFFKSVFLSLINAQTWLGGIYIMLMNLPIIMIGALWGDLYLTQTSHLTHIQASYVNTMLFIGIMLGSPLFGLISDKIDRRKLPLFFGCSLALICSLFLYIKFHSVESYMALFFLLGFFSSAQSVGYPTIVENNPINLAGTASGVASIIIMGGGALFKVFYAWILDDHWHGKIYDHLPVYSHHAFNIAMSILPISFFICILSTIFIRETFCKVKI